jgi:two-component system, LytTR family, response regulator
MDKLNYFLLPTDKGTIYIECIDIVRIEAISNYSKLFFTNGKTLVVAKVLHWFEDNLAADLFVRVHRSHLINIAHIMYCSLAISNGITLMDNSLIIVPRRRKDFIKKILRDKVAA